jgi:hypothetical protein
MLKNLKSTELISVWQMIFYSSLFHIFIYALFDFVYLIFLHVLKDIKGRKLVQTLKASMGLFYL